MTTPTAQAPYRGVIPPMITPLRSDGEVDDDAIDRLTEYLVEGGVSGIFVLGTSGEGPWLTPRQQVGVIERVAGQLDGRVALLAGVLEPSTRRTLEAIAAAKLAGAEAIVATVPYYFPADAEAQLFHFRAVARAADPLPVLVYNIPQRTQAPIEVETLRALLAVQNIVGIKDSAADSEMFRRILALKRERQDYIVLQGAEKAVAASMAEGADGCVPGMGNIAPGLFVTAIARSGAAAEVEQARIDRLWTLHTYGFNLACLKFAASLLGFGSGATCQHSDPLPDSAKRSIADLVQQVVPLPVN